MINPQTPYQIKSYFPESSLQKLKPFFGQIFFEDLDFSPSSVRIVSAIQSSFKVATNPGNLRTT